MKNTFGNEVTVTLFGESHGPAIGCVIDGLPSGFRIDEEQLKQDMDKRRAVGAISTGRHEADEVQFLSGVKDGVTEGTPLAILIANTNVRSKDYSALENLARPGHADYTAEMRYHGFQDTRGGGHFSGRLTAPIVAAGSILRQMLAGHGILIATHIASLHGIEDDSFSEGSLKEQMELLNGRAFAVLNEATGEKMQQEIRKAAESLDSVGGISFVLRRVICLQRCSPFLLSRAWNSEKVSGLQNSMAARQMMPLRSEKERS